MARVDVLRDFPRSFWLANVMELFERAAYYGLNSVLAVYLAGKTAEGGLGFDVQSVGFLQGIIYAAVYVLPILGGALADRFGYRRMLVVAFALLAAGYFAAGQMSSYAAVFLGLLVMATGAGLFKPIISGTIARTTDARTSSLGFGIYYWMINLGAMVAPLVVTWLRGFSWSAVFTASALYCAAMLVLAGTAYREPARTTAARSLGDTLRGAVDVLGDARFMLMIVVYSGFWVLYFQNFGTVLWYLDDVVDKAPVDAAVNGLLGALHLPASFHFDAEHVTVINALTIIALQFVVSRIVKDLPAVPTMAAGMAIGAAGFLCLAASTHAWVFVAGIAIFSIGEMTAHPKYYSYIGLVAPPDKVAVYMGYAFLYGVFGALLGSNAGAFLYETLLKPVLHTPQADARARVFWLLFAVLDVLSVAGLVLFARAFGQDTPVTRRRAAVVMRFVYLGIALVGVAAITYGVRAQPQQFKTIIQGGIFALLGAGGLIIGARRTA